VNDTRDCELENEVLTRERVRLATQLHDGPIQRLTAVALTLDLFAMRLDAGDVAGAREYAEQARSDLAVEMTALRNLMTELRAPVLDEATR
jgi:signal transduction histidine kinase